MVRDELKKLKLHFVVVNLVEVQIMDDNTEELRQQLKTAFMNTCLELMDDKCGLLVERIKNVIIEMVHYAETDKIRKMNFSDF